MSTIPTFWRLLSTPWDMAWLKSTLIAVGFLCQTAASFDTLCDSCAAIATSCLAPFFIGDAPPRIPPDLDERVAAGDEDDEVCLL